MSQATRRALYGKLAGDSTLNNLLGTPPTGWTHSIYYEQAPSGAAFPYLILQKMSGTPSYTFNSTTTIDDEIWLVKAIAKATDTGAAADAVETIQARLGTLLTDGTLSISGKTQLYLRRESDVDYSENADGEEYKHAGSNFRLSVV